MLVHVLGRKIMLFFACHVGSCFLLHVTLVHVFPCHGVSCFFTGHAGSCFFTCHGGPCFFHVMVVLIFH